MTIERVVYHPLTVLLMTIICVLFYWSLLKTDQNLERSRQTLSKLIIQTEKAQKEVAELESSTQFATASANQEFTIRDELLMKKPSEFVIQLPNPQETQSPSNEVFQDRKTIWEKWKLVLGIS